MESNIDNQRKRNQSQGNIPLNRIAKFDEDYKAASESQKAESAGPIICS